MRIGLADKHLIDGILYLALLHAQAAGGIPLGIDVDGQHLLPQRRQTGAQVDVGGGFPHPALLICNGDNLAQITILPTDKEVLEFLTDVTLADAMAPGTVILEMSSTTTGAVQQIEHFYASRGIQIVDAPVSGGVAGAQNGRLTVFGAGPEEAQQKVRLVLDVFSATVYSLGPCGMGKTIKNLDKLLSLYNLMGLCEAYHIAMKNGVDPQLFYEVIGSNSGASRALTNRWPKLVNGDFEPGFTYRFL